MGIKRVETRRLTSCDSMESTGVNLYSPTSANGGICPAL
jgi:hypothetical protein